MKTIGYLTYLLLLSTFFVDDACSQRFELTERLEMIPPPALHRNGYINPRPLILVNDNFMVKINNSQGEVELVIPNMLKSRPLAIYDSRFKGGARPDEPYPVLVVDYDSDLPGFIIDKNQNYDFSDDGEPLIFSDKDSMDLTFANSKNQEAKTVYRLARFNRPKASMESIESQVGRSHVYDGIPLAPVKHWFHEAIWGILAADIQIDDISFRLGLLDYDYNGLYTDDRDILLVSEPGQTRINIDMNGTNNVSLGPKSPFAVGNIGFEIIDIDPSGTSIEIKVLNNFSGPSKINLLGQKISDVLKVTDLNGKQVNLRDQIVPGKYNYVEFWGTWCVGCVKEIPALKEANVSHSDNLEIIGLHYGAMTGQGLVEYIDKKGIDWKQFIVSRETVDLVQPQGFPYGILIGPDEKVIAYFITLADVLERIDK